MYPNEVQSGYGLFSGLLPRLLDTLTSPMGILGSWGSRLPSEAELRETYAMFPELPRWAGSLATFAQQHWIDPLIRDLDTSDQMLTQGFQSKGWRFTCEVPQQEGMYGASYMQVVSVFDPDLPPIFASDHSARMWWDRRQQMESLLWHPGFDRVAQRQFVLERLRDWSRRGLGMASSTSSCSGVRGPSSFPMRSGVGAASLPTDEHILENVVMKWFKFAFPEFLNCYVTQGGPRVPPLGQHLGQPPVVWLRQVTDQRPTRTRQPPHYEVVTFDRIFKLRPGLTNLLEALVLLLQVLRTRRPNAYQIFPANIRSVVENTPLFGGMGFNAGAAGAGQFGATGCNWQ